MLPGARLAVSRQYVTKRGITVRKLLICALALGGFAASAQAADLSVDSLKDPLPEKLSFAGVTVYGTIDVGYGYNSHGLPESSYLNTSLDYGLQKLSGVGPVNALQNNALEQSKIGVKIEESVGMGFVALGKLETNFDPASGQLADACQSVLQASNSAFTASNAASQTGATKPTAAANLPAAAYADGNRCGQAFSGAAYAGLSNATYGTVTAGRQSTFMNDGVGTYDPMHASYAFSLIGFSGGAAAGIGTTETARWDNSVKYIYQFGPLHAGAMYSAGGPGTELLGWGAGANVGATYKGFSLDGYYTKENAAVALAPNMPGYSTTASAPYSSSTVWNLNSQGLTGTVTNNEAFSVMGKYTYDLGGGFKDDAPTSKLTFFGGYVHMDLSNADHLQNYYNGNTTEGGYVLGGGGASNPFATDKILQTGWVGATYDMGAWSFTGAYYHEHQDAYTTGAGATCATGTKGSSGITGKAAVDTTPSNCAGDIDWGSFLVDYKFNKHFDVYTGVSVEEVGGALGSGFLATENISVASGVRLKF